ncbi:hypothetical protein CJ215_03185 [Gardnerella swidsinskii]|nr:hypothetical protein CJ215_03185 [Gardnerella vaginalis]
MRRPAEALRSFLWTYVGCKSPKARMFSGICADDCTSNEKNGDARAGNALATKLALEVPRTSNLSEFPL